MLSLGIVEALSPHGEKNKARWSEQAEAQMERRTTAPPGHFSPLRMALGLHSSSPSIQGSTGFRSPRDNIEEGSFHPRHRVEAEDNILLPKVRKGLGPNNGASLSLSLSLSLSVSLSHCSGSFPVDPPPPPLFLSFSYP